ncbi:MAG: hypothetical protein HY699_12110 [Deltaproteobacteria bacterium]|nr:hypothetical protein [Deltaproteobacteria bacterium]
MAPALHKLGDEFDDRNMFLQVALGLVSFCRQLDCLADDYGRPSAGAAAGAEPAPVVDAALGLIALSRQVMTHLSAARSATQSPEEPPKPARRLELRGVLV